MFPSHDFDGDMFLAKTGRRWEDGEHLHSNRHCRQSPMETRGSTARKMPPMWSPLRIPSRVAREWQPIALETVGAKFSLRDGIGTCDHPRLQQRIEERNPWRARHRLI